MSKKVISSKSRAFFFWSLPAFVCFWQLAARSPGRHTPIEIRRAGRAASRKSDQLQLLLEQWVTCGGQWKASEFYYQIKQKKRNRRHGCRKWLTLSELTNKYGSQDIAMSIVEQKLQDAEVAREQVRCHPDMHGVDTEESSLQVV